MAAVEVVQRLIWRRELSPITVGIIVERIPKMGNSIMTIHEVELVVIRSCLNSSHRSLQ